MAPEEYERQDIEVLNEVAPYCFESDREEQWFKVGLQYGLDAADADPLSQWISVKDDLPCNHEELIIKHDDWEILETKPVFVHYKNGGFGIRHMWKPKNEPWIWFPNTSDIDYWMPIPELPKE